MRSIIIGLALVSYLSFFTMDTIAQTAPQTTNAQQNASSIIIKPSMPIDYIVFASNALTTIEIQGSEVDVYMICKNALDTELKKYIAEKRRTDEVVTFGIQIEIAQNLITFLNRAKLTGNDAPKFKGFVNALMTAGKNYKPDTK